MLEETVGNCCVGLGWVGGAGNEGTSVDEVRNLLTRNWMRRVLWHDAVLLIPVSRNSNVADFVNLLSVLNIPKDEIRARLNPDPIHVGARCDFYTAWGQFPQLRGLVGCSYEYSRYSDDKSFFYGKLRVDSAPGEESDKEPKRQAEEEGREQSVSDIQGPPGLGPERIKAVERRQSGCG